MKSITLVLLSTACLGVGDQDDFRGAGANVPPSLECIIRSEKKCQLGSAPRVRVRIVNRTGREIVLVGSLDASDKQFRYPYCYYEVIGPDGKNAVKPAGVGCGNHNKLRSADFVKVAQRGEFDPYQKIDRFGFFSAHQLHPSTFDVPGKYRIRFIYCTTEKDIRKWEGKPDDELVKLFSQVPKITMKSNGIVVEVVDEGKEK
jgi:hypothetical protein